MFEHPAEALHLQWDSNISSTWKNHLINMHVKLLIHTVNSYFINWLVKC